MIYIYVLLIIIAIGVLLMSPEGKKILVWIMLAIGIVGLVLLVLGALILGYVFLTSPAARSITHPFTPIGESIFGTIFLIGLATGFLYLLYSIIRGCFAVDKHFIKSWWQGGAKKNFIRVGLIIFGFVGFLVVCFIVGWIRNK